MADKSGSSSDDDLWMMIILMAIFMAFAYFGREPFLKAAYYSSYWALHLEQTLGLLDNEERSMMYRIAARLDLLKDWSDAFKEIPWESGKFVLNETYRPLASLFAIIFGFFGVTLLFFNKINNYIRNFNMRRLLYQQARVFPEVRPVCGLDTYLMDRKNMFSGPWRAGDTPIRLALRHKLLLDGDGSVVDIPDNVEIRDNPEEDGILNIDPRLDYRIAREAWTLDKKKTKEVFEEQLGMCLIEDGKYKLGKILNMPKQHKCLLAAFILIRYVGRKAGYKLLEQLNNSFWSGSPSVKKDPNFNAKDLDDKWVDDILKSYVFGFDLPEDCPFPPPKGGIKMVQAIQKQIVKHAWSNTILTHFLDNVARQRGIVVTAEFIWLRPIDRTLWYSLNNAGRNNPKNATVFSEAAGVMSHYMIEQALDEPLMQPDVDEAVKGFEDALYKEGWIKNSQRQNIDGHNRAAVKLGMTKRRN